MENAPLFELDAVTKRFPGVTALDRVSLRLMPGEVHALVGENGAGKSTLINLLCGVLRPDEGEIRLKGRPISLRSSVEARQHRIVVVHQEVDVFEPLSVAESMALGSGLPTRLGLIRWRSAYQQARAAIKATGETIDPSEAVGDLSLAQRQMLAIATALQQDPWVVLLDEPTSSLSRKESEWLFIQVERLKSAGAGILYISHRSEEIARLADRVTVLRDGKVVGTDLDPRIDRDQLIQLMVGRETGKHEPQTNRPTDVDSPTVLNVVDATDRAGRFRNVSLSVHRGEILGIYGLIGAGRSEWAQAIFGLRPISAGRIEVNGEPLEIRSPSEAVKAGIAYLPEDRLREGIFPGLAIRSNLVVASLKRLCRGPFTSRHREVAAAQAPLKQTAVKAQSIEQPIRELSGGNQQKVVFGRWLLTQPKILILDEPTRGVDIGSKAEIHRLIQELAQTGTAVILISSDLPEVLAETDRIAIFRTGELATTLSREESTAELVAAAAVPSTFGSDSALKTGRTTKRWRELGLPVAIGLIAALLCLTSGGRFTTSDNLIGILSNASVLTILALGSAFVMISGGIDISIGSLLALSAASSALTFGRCGDSVGGILAGIGVGLGVGLTGGLLNATIALAGRIHPVVVTLGMMTVYRGLLLVLTGGAVLGGLPSGFRDLANGRFWGIPGAVLILMSAAGLAQVVLSSTRAGRHLYAQGANPRSARLVGISRVRVWLTSFSVGGICSALAGLLELAQNGSMQSVMGQGYELKAISAAVIGGVAISGGGGSVRGVVLGGLLLSLVQNALVLWSVSQYHYELIIGGILLMAILLDRLARRSGR